MPPLGKKEHVAGASVRLRRRSKSRRWRDDLGQPYYGEKTRIFNGTCAANRAAACYFDATNSASTRVEMPPRAVNDAVSFIHLGCTSPATSSRIRFVTCS